MKETIFFFVAFAIFSVLLCVRMSGDITRKEEENEHIDIDHDESGLIEED